MAWMAQFRKPTEKDPHTELVEDVVRGAKHVAWVDVEDGSFVAAFHNGTIELFLLVGDMQECESVARTWVRKNCSEKAFKYHVDMLVDYTLHGA